MRKFLLSFLLLILTLMLALKLRLFFGYAPDLVFALLVAFGFTLSFSETLFLAAFAAWVLNWQPFPGPELWVMAAIVLLAYLGRYFMPFERWLSFVIFTVAGIGLISLAAAPGVILASWRFLTIDALISTIFGLFMMRMMRIFDRREF